MAITVERRNRPQRVECGRRVDVGIGLGELPADLERRLRHGGQFSKNGFWGSGFWGSGVRGSGLKTSRPQDPRTSRPQDLKTSGSARDPRRKTQDLKSSAA